MRSRIPELSLDMAIATAREAGDLVVQRLETPVAVRSKGLRDVVTDVDIEAQTLISERLRVLFPEHAIWAEEGDAAAVGSHEGYTWIVDPLDGSNNYSRRHPTFAVSIALALDGEVLLGAVYEPLRGFLFHAQRGQGAFVNGRPLNVSAVAEWGGAMVACDWARDQTTRLQVLHMVALLIPEIHTFRTIGAAALGFCYVAAGWLDAYFSLHLSPWDMAAGALILEEAGGTVTTAEGTPWQLVAGGFLASNSSLHPHLLHSALDALGHPKP